MRPPRGPRRRRRRPRGARPSPARPPGAARRRRRRAGREATRSGRRYRVATKKAATARTYAGTKAAQTRRARRAAPAARRARGRSPRPRAARGVRAHEEELQREAPLAVPREAEVERRLVAREDEADLLREKSDRRAGLGPDPRPRLPREVRRDLARGERPPLLRLRKALRVRGLSPDVGRDPGDRAVDAVRAGPVADEEVQAAVGRDQDGLAGDDQVAREGQRDDRGGSHEQRHGRPSPPDGEGHGDRGDAQERIWTVQGEQAAGSARGQPHLRRKTAFRQPHRNQVQEQRGQEWVQRGLQDQDLVERHDAGERVENSRDERGAVVEEPARHPPDEPDGRRPERDLDDLRREERAPRERVDRGEEINVERRDEIRHGTRPPEKHVAARHVRGQPGVDAAVHVPRRLQERVGIETREQRRLQGESGEKKKEKPAAHAARLARVSRRTRISGPSRSTKDLRGSPGARCR